MIKQPVMDACIDIARQVSATIAPTWPLDQSVAVNPWWQLRHHDIQQVFAEQAVICGETSLMSKGYYRQLWGKQIGPQHRA